MLEFEWVWVIVPLFSRFAGDATLRSARRRAMLDLVADGPLSFGELRRRLGVHRSTVEHHATYLARSGRARVARVGGEWFLLLPGQEIPRGSPQAEAWVLATVRAQGETPRALLHAKAAGASLSRRSVNQAVRSLLASKALLRRGEGRSQVLAAADLGPIGRSIPLEVSASPSPQFDVDDGPRSVHVQVEAASGDARAAGGTRRDGGAPPGAGEAEGARDQALPPRPRAR